MNYASPGNPQSPLDKPRFPGGLEERGACVFFPVVVSALLLPLDCYAYIDPNMGGWLFQLLFPVFVAIGGVWTIFRHRIGALWHRIFRRSDKRK